MYKQSAGRNYLYGWGVTDGFVILRSQCKRNRPGRTVVISRLRPGKPYGYRMGLRA